MQEWSGIIKAITDKVGDFLNIFDLSFLVSGAACLSGIYFICTILTETTYNISTPIAIMAAYILGLLCFTIGRWARKDFRREAYDKEFNRLMEENIVAHKIGDLIDYKVYFSQTNVNYNSLYVRMWADLREIKDYRTSLSIVNRYWVMSATYDGLAVACFVWLSAFEYWWWKNGIIPKNITYNEGIYYIVYVLTTLIFVIISYRCSCEASRYSKNQIEEVIATIASWKK